MAWQKHLIIMRFLYRLLFSALLVFLAGCSAPESISGFTSTPQTTPEFHQPGSLVQTSSDAIAVGGKLFEEQGGFQWTRGPEPVFTEELSYEGAVALMGIGDGEYNLWPPETRVWLVVFEGQWLLAPLDPNQSNPAPLPYEGCLVSVFTAADGELISMGDATCPPN
jgi:hypothetical protein